MVNLKGHGKRIKSKYDCIRLYENGNVIWDIPNHPQYMVKLEYREGKDDKSFRLLKELLTAYPDELVIENFVETYGISFSRNSKRYDSIKTKLAICKCMERFIENISD